jgi:predicted PurR-regulated permease PerM
MNHRESNDALPEVSLTISSETFFKVVSLAVGTLLILLAAQKASHALLLLLASVFLALALNGPVSWIGRHLPGKLKDSRSLATSLSYLIVLAILGVFLASLVPPLVRQTESLARSAPHLIQQVRNQNGEVGQLIRKYHLQKQINAFSSQLSERISHAGGSAFSTAQKIGSSAFSLVTILVLTFMMLIEGPNRMAWFRSITPGKHRAMTDRVANNMYRVIKGYVNGQVILAALASALISPALFALHISYAAALIGVIFICGLIPMIGHTIGAVIITIVAAFHSFPAAVIIFIYYIVYQQIENIFIQPRIQANSTNMSPLLVFASVIVGVSFGGLIGGLFAIPIAGCIRVLLLEYLASQEIISVPAAEKAVHE